MRNRNRLGQRMSEGNISFHFFISKFFSSKHLNTHYNKNNIVKKDKSNHPHDSHHVQNQAQHYKHYEEPIGDHSGLHHPHIDKKRQNYRLLEAAENGDLELVKALLKDGADINAKDGSGWTPIMRAIAANHDRMVALLIEKGADVNATSYGWTPMTLAEFEERHHSLDGGIVKLLKMHGAR